MPITRKWQSDYSGWQAGWCGGPYAGKWPDQGLRYFHREYAGSGGINALSVSFADSSHGGGAKACLSLWERWHGISRDGEGDTVR